MADADFESRVAATEATLRVAAERELVTVTADGRISERAASQLLGFSDRYLADQRAAELGPAYFDRPAGGGGRYSYRLRDLATWLERSRRSTLVGR